MLAAQPSIEDIPERLRQWPTWLLGRLHAGAKRAMTAMLAAEDLSMHDYAVLACVEEFMPLSQQQVCDRLGIDRADMVSIVDHLEEIGALVRNRDRSDRRRYLLQLTHDGRLKLKRADRIIAAATDDFLAALTPGEIETLRVLTLRVLQPDTI